MWNAGSSRCLRSSSAADAELGRQSVKNCRRSTGKSHHAWEKVTTWAVYTTTALRMDDRTSHDFQLNHLQAGAAGVLESPPGDLERLPSPSPDRKETNVGEGIQLATLDLLYGWRLWLNLSWYAAPHLRLTTDRPFSFEYYFSCKTTRRLLINYQIPTVWRWGCFFPA